MGRATEELAARSGPGIGGLLNVTFGNAPELIIALFALEHGPAGGRQGVARRLDPRQHPARPGRRDARRRLKRERQTSTAPPPARSRSMLLLAVRRADHAGDLRARRAAAACRSPAPSASTSARDLEHLSLVVALVLLLSYVAGLVFSLQDPPRALQPEHAEDRRARRRARGRVRRSRRSPWRVAGVAVGVMSEILVGSIAEASHVDRPVASSSSALIVVAIVGNAAEHWVAVYFASQGQDGPRRSTSRSARARRSRCSRRRCSCCCSFFIGPHPMALVFNGFELGGDPARGR